MHTLSICCLSTLQSKINFRGGKKFVQLEHGDFREQTFRLTSFPALHCMRFGKPRLRFRGGQLSHENNKHLYTPQKLLLSGARYTVVAARSQRLYALNTVSAVSVSVLCCH